MEQWRTISGYENYQVSNLGRVKSLNYNRTNKSQLLKPNINQGGYSFVILSNNSNKKKYLIHQLVAITFLNYKPNGNKIVIDHINSDSLDNRLENLRIVSGRENHSKERTLKSGLPVGVSFKKSNEKYLSQIRIKGKKIYIGQFSTIEEASEAYQKVLQNNE
jgi:hypothetical protein